MSIHPDATLELVTMEVAGQQFGIPVAHVRDVLGPQRVTRIPLAPAAVSGSLNLRGRIVTVLDMCVSLGLGRTTDAERAMHVVIDHGGELYSLLVDQVGDVLPVSGATIEAPPATLDPGWRSVSDGIVKLQDRLMLVLLLDRVLATVAEPARAA
jgi:purine-binding chemotaxis protein CheW